MLPDSVLPGAGTVITTNPVLNAYTAGLRIGSGYRRTEFTCDRAALLCLQDLEPSLRALAKLPGTVAGYEDEVNLESAIRQSKHGRM